MKKLVRWSVRISLVIGSAVVLCLLYLHLHGFPGFTCRFVERQFAQAGFAVQFRELHLDWFQGVLAHDLTLADAQQPDKPLAHINEVSLHFNWNRLIHHQNALGSLRIKGANISVPTPPDEIGPEKFTATDAHATIRFEDDGSIRLEQLTGMYCGIGLYVAGRVVPSGIETPRRKPNEQFAFLTKTLRELRAIHCREPIQLRLDFDLDLANPLAVQAKAWLRGTGMSYRRVWVDGLNLRVEMSDGAARFSECRLRMGGGAVTLNGSYDIANANVDLRVVSTIHPFSLRGLLPPAAEPMLRELRIEHNPTIRARYALTPETGTMAVLSGSLEVGGVAFRGVAFRSIACEFENHGPDIDIRNAKIVMAEGQLTGRGHYHIESSDFEYELDSTLDPTKLLPLMTPIMKHWVEPAHFQASPHIIAKVQGDFVDNDAFAYDAEVNTGPCSYRGVPLVGGSGKLHLYRNQLDVRDFFLQRADGKMTGALHAEFDYQRLHFNLDTTANPSPMAYLLGPKPAQIIEPYHLGTNIVLHGEGWVDFAEPRRTFWTATGGCDAFAWQQTAAGHVNATLGLTNETLRVQARTHDATYGAKLKADILNTDFTVIPSNAIPIRADAEGVSLGALRASKARASTIWTNGIPPAVQLTGEQVAFGTLRAAAAQALVIGDTNNITASVTATNLTWWKLTGDTAAANLAITTNLITISNLAINLYDGKLTGPIEIQTRATNSTYHLALDAAGWNLKRMFDSLGQGPTNLSGIVTGRVELDGDGADLATMRGKGRLEVADSVLVELPLFGVFSSILNAISPGLGSTKFNRATADFTVEDNAIKTDNLLVNAGAFTITARGKIEMTGALDFRVRLHFLQRIPGINLLWDLFIGNFLEYKIGGSLGKPTYRPLRLPSELLPHSKDTPPPPPAEPAKPQ